MKTKIKKLLEIEGSVIKDSNANNNETPIVKFNSGADIASFFETDDSTAASVIENTFEKVLNDWDLLEYIQEAISRQLVNDFNEGQLACIFEVLTEENLRLDDAAGVELKARVLDYINTEGKLIFNLGNVEEFVAQINSINPIIFTILVSKIKKHYDELYNTDFQKQILIGLSDFSKIRCNKLYGI
jgi:hypothetical protein